MTMKFHPGEYTSIAERLKDHAVKRFNQRDYGISIAHTINAEAQDFRVSSADNKTLIYDFNDGSVLAVNYIERTAILG